MRLNLDISISKISFVNLSQFRSATLYMSVMSRIVYVTNCTVTKVTNCDVTNGMYSLFNICHIPVSNGQV